MGQASAVSIDAVDHLLAHLQEGVLKVHELNGLVRLLLEHALPVVWVEGEVSDLVKSRQGHLYFMLNDERAQLKCVMFRSDLAALKVELQNGLHLKVRGLVTLYEPRGQYQLQIREVNTVGAGAKAEELERLRQKLENEGLLGPKRQKRHLPRYPRTIGVVTSREGAAWRDIVRVSLARFPAHLVLSHTSVQGSEAPEEIVRAIRALENAPIPTLDVIIVARGGGASEDLAAFNDERVLRAIARARVPVVTGIGHEIDVTLADLCADQRAATPSHAAETVVPLRSNLEQELVGALRALEGGIDKRIGELRLVLEKLSRSLQVIHRFSKKAGPSIDHLQRQLERIARSKMREWRAKLEDLIERLGRAEPRLRLKRLNNQLEEAAKRLEPPLHRILEAHRRVLTRFEAQAPLIVSKSIDKDRRHLEHLNQALYRLVERISREKKARFAEQIRALHALSPLAVLERGYAIVFLQESSTIVRSPSDVPQGALVHIQLARGVLKARAM
ncbi:MAG: exodeoxyribonuclease VII large subunit [Sandaracinaceae bacterium]|nr:exodeoxyribonuclease VII large subunit [Sandaracinaceae bacterium]MDW8246489.1 exodeoxyribonuclease VII large subunit [Sandaracinaceae bacterium]